MGKDQGIVEDTRTKLKWQRCSLGQTWTGATCAGEATKYKWNEARRVAPAGWRLPTKDELASLVYCSSGEPTYWKTESQTCKGDYGVPTLWVAAFPNTPEEWFWSSSPTVGNPYQAWYAHFGDGRVGSLANKEGAIYVRYVHDGPNADAQAAVTQPDPAAPTPPVATTTLPTIEPNATQQPFAPVVKAPLYYAAALAPTANIPPEAPLCYKFMVAGPEEQLQKLKDKYSEIYGVIIQNNPDGSKNLVAKRKDETGKEISYFYATNPVECNEYQRHRIGVNNNQQVLSIDTEQREKLWEMAQNFFNSGNYISGIKLLQPLIDTGDSEVLLRLGEVFIVLNPDESARWYRLAAQQLQQEAESGNKFSSYKLAGLYEKGYGIAKDSAKAEYWYRTSAEQGILVDQKVPAKEYQCVYTTVKRIGTRLLNTPESGTSITFNNDIYLVSYDTVPQAEISRKNDKVKICLIEVPADCPPGDERGKVYTVINLRTNRVFNMPDSSHMCGGA